MEPDEEVSLVVWYGMVCSTLPDSVIYLVFSCSLHSLAKLFTESSEVEPPLRWATRLHPRDALPAPWGEIQYLQIRFDPFAICHVLVRPQVLGLVSFSPPLLHTKVIKHNAVIITLW